MFRIHDNVPQIYVQESRDFQLLCRIYDAAFSGVKFDIDTIVDTLDAMTTRDTLLELMATRLGFFYTSEIDSQVLKYIVASFPYIIKNKGTQLGIEYAVNAILKAETLPQAEQLVSSEIYINNKDYTVSIYTPQVIYNQNALRELLKYVLPTGYTYSNQVIGSTKEYTDEYNVHDSVTFRQGTASQFSLIVPQNNGGSQP